MYYDYYHYQLFYLTQSGLGGARCCTNKEQNPSPALQSVQSKYKINDSRQVQRDGPPKEAVL